MLAESGKRVRDAVQGRALADLSLDRDFAHPIQLLQFLIFHDGYHHGQIKLALKAAGSPIADEDAGPSSGTFGGMASPGRKSREGAGAPRAHER